MENQKKMKTLVTIVILLVVLSACYAALFLTWGKAFFLLVIAFLVYHLED